MNPTDDMPVFGPQRSRANGRVATHVDVLNDLDALLVEAAIAPIRIVHPDKGDVYIVGADTFERVFSIHRLAQKAEAAGRNACKESEPR